MTPAAVALVYRGQAPARHERELASATDLPLLARDALVPERYPLYLALESAGLTLYPSAAKRSAGLRVDFAAPAIRRRAGDRFLKQNLAKAVGIKGGRRPSVVDATAGLGVDAYLLALAGCQVTLVERNPVVHALLQDGIARAAASAQAEAVSRLRLVCGDFRELAASLASVDVVYLDPMFPTSRKSARSGLAMALLQQLLHPAEENTGLFASALTVAGQRVVVKRARLSESMGGQEPDLCFRGSSSRFDVYFGPAQAMR